MGSAVRIREAFGRRPALPNPRLEWLAGFVHRLAPPQARGAVDRADTRDGMRGLGSTPSLDWVSSGFACQYNHGNSLRTRLA